MMQSGRRGALRPPPLLRPIRHARSCPIAMAALALAAAAALSGAAADGAESPWGAAYAQEPPTPPVRIGALMAPGDSFDDTDRILALRHAVGEFNRQSGYAALDLSEHNFTRGGELEALRAAYAGGTGPSYYIGPTTSAGLSSIMGFANRSGIVLVSPASDAAPLAVPGDTTFRLTISVDNQARSLARIMSNASIDAAVTVIRDDTWGQSFNASLNEALALRGIALAGSVPFAASGADWGAAAAAAGEAAARAASAPGEPRAAVVFAGFGGDYRGMATAVAAAGAGPGEAASPARSLPWFVPSAAIVASALAPISNDTVRDFSASVNLTALGHNAPSNAVTDALDAALARPGSDPKRLTYYEYAAYDSLFVLGTAIGMARDAAGGGTAPPDPAVVAAAMPAAALAHDGALGRIALNSKGDLLMPDAFGVWRVDPAGAWIRVGTASSGTPVTDIGMLAILAGGHEANRVAAARMAVNDHNWEQEAAAPGAERHYLHLSVYNITVDDSPPRVLDALRAAHADGAGPSLYVGPSTSGNTGRVLGYANERGIVLVSPSATAPSLSIEGDNLFRLAPDDSQQGLVLASVIGRDLGAAAGAGAGGTVVVAARDDAWGRDLNRTASGRLAALGLDVAPIEFSERADWPSVAQRLNAAIESARAGGGPAAVLFVGLAPDFRGIAPLASAALPWYAPDSIAASRDVAGDAAARAFADAVNLTATLFDAPANAEQDRVRSSLAKMGVSGLRTYDYSTYDSVGMLGAAILDARGSGGGDADGVAAAIPRAAAAYEGALGDIALNSKGDLRTPNDYALWTMDGGAWKRLEVFPGTPVVEFGALVSLDGTPASDAARLEAMRLAADEYNRAAEEAGGPMYIDLSAVRASIVPAAATPESPAAADALRAAYAGGDGPSYYIGPTTSGNAARVLGFADSNNITLISPSSTAASLAIEGDALFRLAPNDALQGRVLADIVHNRQGDIIAGLVDGSGAEAVVSLARNDTWGRGLDASASARLALHGIPVTRILHAPHGADWPAVASRLDSEIASLQAGGAAAVAVLHVGFQGDFAAIAEQSAAGGGGGRMASVPWYGTDGVARGSSIVSNPASLALAEAVNLTATVFDAPGSDRLEAVRSALAARGVASPGPYSYSSYDSVLVMAAAVERAMAAKGPSYAPADVRGEVRAAAAAHDGALGDIELNRAGDLRTPNGYAVWTVEDGAWKRAGMHPPTPVFGVGALLVLGAGQPYTDGAELGAIEAAIDDFNTDHELVGDFYLDLEVQRIRASPGSGSGSDSASGDPGALAGLEAARAGGGGPSYYIGPSSSANAARMLDYANRNGLVLVSPSSTDPSLAVPGDALFRMIPDYSLHAEAVARLLAERGASEVVLAVRDDAWGRGVAESVRAAIADAAANAARAAPSVALVSFAEDGADWAAVSREIGEAARSAASRAAASSAQPPAVVFAGFEGDFAALAAQAAADPGAARLLASAEWIDAGGIGARPPASAGAGALELARAVNLTAVRFFPPSANDITARLDPAASYGPSAYDSVRVLGAAIGAAYAAAPNGSAPPGPAVGAAMQAAARAHSGALGNITLGDSGDLEYPATFGVYGIGAAGGWDLRRVVSAGPAAAGSCPADARCIAIGELRTAELAAPAREIHEAYAVAAEDFNRRQIESGDSPRLHVVLERADISLGSPLEGLRAAHAGGAGPSAYVGPITSASAQAMKPLIDEAGIVLVSPTSAATTGGLAEADTLFRLALSDRYEADLLAIAAGREGVAAIVPAVRGDAYGLSYASELRAEGRLLGIDVLDPVVMDVGGPDGGILDARAAAAELNRRAAASPAPLGIVVAGTAADLGALAAHAAGHPLLAEARWFEPGNLYPPRPIADAETLGLAGTAQLFSTQWDVPRTDRLDDVHGRLAARAGIEPHMHSYAAYDAVLLLADAMGRSMAADGSYAAADVAAAVPESAARLGGLLGDGIVLDAAGDRASPSSVVLWRTERGTGEWADAGRLHLDPICGIAIRSPELALGDVRAGSTSAEAVQGVRSAGTAPVAGLAVEASPWTSAATGAEALPSSATQVRVGPDWVPLSGAVDVADHLSPEWSEVAFRVSPGADTAADAAGPSLQSVTYIATCG